MTPKEAQRRAEKIWGDKVKVQLRPAQFQVIVPAKTAGEWVLVGAGETWDLALRVAKQSRDTLAQERMLEAAKQKEREEESTARAVGGCQQ